MLRRTKSILALVCALAIIVTGTFAWQQIGRFRNEFRGNFVRKEVILHDDYDPSTGEKDVYVENTGDATLYVRIKLAEFMDLTTSDPSTIQDLEEQFKTHKYDGIVSGEACADCGLGTVADKLFHNYFTWEMGGQKYYMPAVHQPPANKVTGNVYQNLESYTKEQYEDPLSNVAQTPFALIISAQDFINMSEADQKALEAWICTSDGYAYWSQPLEAGAVTGLLLKGVATDQILKDTDYYYAIDVILEVVDRADIEMWRDDSANPVDGGEKHQTAADDGKDVIDIILRNNATIKILGGSPTMEVGATYTPKTSIPPELAEFTPVWSSEDSSVATVDANGKITAVAVGTTTITLTVDGKTDSITVTVTEKIIQPGNVKILGDDRSIEVGQEEILVIQEPADITGKTVIWGSSDDNIVTVDADGKIKGIGEGTATITVTVDGISDEITITVTNNSSTGGLQVKASDPITGFMSKEGEDLVFTTNWLNNPNAVGVVNEAGELRLEDILIDSNFAGVTVKALESKYDGFVTVGIGKRSAVPAIMYTYLPTWEDTKPFYEAYGFDTAIPLTTKLLLERDGESVEITVTFTHNEASWTPPKN